MTDLFDHASWALAPGVLHLEDTYQGVRAAAEAACMRTGARLIQARLEGAFGDGAAITWAMEHPRVATRHGLSGSWVGVRSGISGRSRVMRHHGLFGEDDFRQLAAYLAALLRESA
jgi:hypothetical protein